MSPFKIMSVTAGRSGGHSTSVVLNYSPTRQITSSMSSLTSALPTFTASSSVTSTSSAVISSVSSTSLTLPRLTVTSDDQDPDPGPTEPALRVRPGFMWPPLNPLRRNLSLNHPAKKSGTSQQEPLTPQMTQPASPLSPRMMSELPPFSDFPPAITGQKPPPSPHTHTPPRFTRIFFSSKKGLYSLDVFVAVSMYKYLYLY